MGKSKSALPDLTRAIQLKPDFLAVSSQVHNQSQDNSFLNFVHVVFIFRSLGSPLSPLPFITFLHSQARLQRGNILLKQGNTQEAREDFEEVVG